MNESPEKLSSSTWIDHMLSGNFEAAWQFSDQVLALQNGKTNFTLPRHLQNIWTGESLNDKIVLVRCYHGLGDTIQFIRYMPLLRSIAHRVIVWMQPQLISLLSSVEGIDEILPLNDGTPDVNYDADIEIMELPHYFRTSLQTIPSKIPYLFSGVRYLSETAKPKIGLVWQAGDWDAKRGIPFSLLEPLFNIAEIEIFILQFDAPAAGWKQGYGNYKGNFELKEFAAIVKGLDLLITVDSMPAHLAGALGVPVWTLLRANNDWRWMKDRDDSPWYPTMKLFRQTKEGIWTDVIERVINELKFLSESDSLKKSADTSAFVSKTMIN